MFFLHPLRQRLPSPVEFIPPVVLTVDDHLLSLQHGVDLLCGHEGLCYRLFVGLQSEVAPMLLLLFGWLPEVLLLPRLQYLAPLCGL